MASKITVLNFTENPQYVAITPTTSGASAVASGTLAVGQTSGFQVPNPGELYNVYFQPQASSGYLTASNVAPNSQVGVSITGGTADETNEDES
jgi:hypothetical protein